MWSYILAAALGALAVAVVGRVVEWWRRTAARDAAVVRQAVTVGEWRGMLAKRRASNRRA